MAEHHDHHRHHASEPKEQAIMLQGAVSTVVKEHKDQIIKEALRDGKAPDRAEQELESLMRELDATPNDTIALEQLRGKLTQVSVGAAQYVEGYLLPRIQEATVQLQRTNEDAAKAANPAAAAKSAEAEMKALFDKAAQAGHDGADALAGATRKTAEAAHKALDLDELMKIQPGPNARAEVVRALSRQGQEQGAVR